MMNMEAQSVASRKNREKKIRHVMTRKSDSVARKMKTISTTSPKNSVSVSNIKVLK